MHEKPIEKDKKSAKCCMCEKDAIVSYKGKYFCEDHFVNTPHLTLKEKLFNLFNIADRGEW